MAGKLAAFRKALNKKDFVTELSNPDVWGSWGSYALNYICTGSFFRGIPNRRVCMTYGPSGTGKSLLLGNAAKILQDLGYVIIYIDTEEAIDTAYLERLGVDVWDEDKFCPIKLSTIEDLVEVTSEIFSSFGKDEKIAIIVDSLGMLETEDHAEEFDKGKMKNDMGIFAKKLKKYLKNIVHKVGERDCFFLCNQHAYANQDITNGRGTHVPSGGEAQIFIPSITLSLKKLKLKDGKDVTGIRLKATTEKTRFQQLGMVAELEIPYKSGIDPFDGVLEILIEDETFAERTGLTKTGAWYSYDRDGETVKFQNKNREEHLIYLMQLAEPDSISEADEGGSDDE